MKKFLPLLAASLPVVALGLSQTADAATSSRFNNGSEAFKFAPKSTYELANGGKALSLQNVKAAKQKARKTITKDDLTTLGSGYATGYLDAPDGSTWFYTQNIEYTEVELEGGWATKKVISKYTFTIYDSEYKEVGTISDDIVLADDETGVSAIELGACVSQKFFNLDSNYEVMVMIAANTAEYVNHVYTKVYSIGVEGAVDTIEGYYINAVNSGTYSEKYYITFFQDPYLDYSEVYGTAASSDSTESSDEDGDEDGDEEESTVYTYKYQVYGPASYSSKKASLLNTFVTPYDQLEGYDSTPFIGVVYGGKPYLAMMKYEKPYFKNSAITYDSSGNMTRDLTPNEDNSLIIDLYTAGYSGLSLSSSTKIPMELKDSTGTTCTFYEVGVLDYSDDISFDVWTHDGKPTFQVAIEDYISSSDESEYAFAAYDVDGNKIADIGEGASALVDMSDLPGYEHQIGLYKTIDGVESFQFVNIPSCKEAVTFSVPISDTNSLTAYCDRLATADSYQYAFSLLYGETDDDDYTSHYFAWYNADGSFDHYEIVPLGQKVAMALPYVKKSVLSPYLFNTNSDREYMFLLKKYISSTGTETEESLIVTNTNGDLITSLTEDDTLGALSSITLMNTDNPALWIVYYNSDTEIYTSSFLPLPLTKFEKGGDGSASNPFLISSVGDLQQMKGNLTANYKIVNDFDAAGFDFQPVGEIFKGSLDGDNHTISNLSLSNDSYYNGIFQLLSGSASVKNINFKNANVIVGSDNTYVGLIAADASGNNSGAPSIENIHVDGYTATADGASSASFGGLVSSLSLNATIKNSSISDASIDMVEDGSCGVSALGGLVCQMKTGASVENCAFQGWVAGGSQVGGIASRLVVTGVSSSEQSHIANCHVNADIEGENVIGGIIAEAGRAPIYNNYVEGSIEASTNERWGGGAKVAGVVGSLDEDWSNSETAVVYNNVVAMSSIAVPSIGDQDYANQATTSHRIVGYTSFNAEPEITGYDSDWNPIYSSEPNDADSGIQNNYVIGDLAVVDSNIEADVNTTEGANLSDDDFTQSFLAEQGYAFGDSASAPWVYASSGLSLYFEDADSNGVSDFVINNTYLQKTEGTFTADGCKLAVYNLYGVKVASATNSVATSTLAPGVYIVTASKDGKVVSTAKFVVK